MEAQVIIEEIHSLLETVLDEKRMYQLARAWLVILRDRYALDCTQFSDTQIQFLKGVSQILPTIIRFIELQEELLDDLGMQEYNLGLQELYSMNKELAQTAIHIRVEKEIRQLKERKSEVMAYEESKATFKRAHGIADIEDAVERCPFNNRHRLQIRIGKTGYFWGCSAFPDCWHTRKLTQAEQEQLDNFVAR